ncbi:MAG: hypothetical protein AAFZ63_23470 [Bacteroidota bacterium]
MKNSLFLGLLLSLCFTTTVAAQDAEATLTESETFGDNFSLEGALEMFKTSESLEEFEAKLNDESNSVNNLDLNEDGDVDYIRVVDNIGENGTDHAIVLQVPINENESQDIAVIAIEKVADEDAMLQIIGDELLYGEDHIVEPFEAEGEMDGKGPSAEMGFRVIRVNVWTWRPVRFIYGPRYVRYVSPWRWNYYPRAWHPWRPVSVVTFRPRVVRYRSPYRVTTTRRVVRAHNVYRPHRRSSAVVVSRRTVRTGRGVKTTTRVRTNRNGKVNTARRTTVKRRRRGGN